MELVEKIPTIASSTSELTIPKDFDDMGEAIPSYMFTLVANLYDGKIDFSLYQLYQLLKLLKEVGEVINTKWRPGQDSDEGNTEDGENNLDGLDLQQRFLITKQRLSEIALRDAEHPSIEAKEAIITLQMMIATLRTSARHGSQDIIQSDSKRKAERQSWRNENCCFRDSVDNERVKSTMVEFCVTADRMSERVGVKTLYEYCRITSRGPVEDEDEDEDDEDV